MMRPTSLKTSQANGDLIQRASPLDELAPPPPPHSGFLPTPLTPNQHRRRAALLAESPEPPTRHRRSRRSNDEAEDEGSGERAQDKKKWRQKLGETFKGLTTR